MNPNKKLIRKALTALEGGKVRLCGGLLKDGGNYCAVGFLTAFAGMKILETIENENGHLSFDSPKGTIQKWNTDAAINFVAKTYGIPRADVSALVDVNDSGDFINRSHRLSRVERLRMGLRAQLSKKAKAVYTALRAKLNVATS